MVRARLGAAQGADGRRRRGDRARHPGAAGIRNLSGHQPRRHQPDAGVSAGPNPGLAAAATGDPAAFPSTQPILYRADRLTLLDQGWFFFSDTPDVIYSPTFDGSWPAFASWAAFRAPSGQVFRVVNVHFEYRSGSNRLLSAALVRDRIAPVIAGGTPVLLVGDINALHGSQTMARLEQAGLDFLPVEGATYHFNRGFNLFGAIDHIAHSGGIAPAGRPCRAAPQVRRHMAQRSLSGGGRYSGDAMKRGRRLPGRPLWMCVARAGHMRLATFSQFTRLSRKFCR